MAMDGQRPNEEEDFTKEKKELLEETERLREKAERLRERIIKNNNSKKPPGKSCKGYLYYTSHLKSNGIYPRCIGVPRSLHQVPSYIDGQTEAEASKEGRSLVDFYYACAGYSVFVNRNDSSDKQPEKTRLPVCVGLELVVDRVNSNTASTPAPVHHREDGREVHQPPPVSQTRRPAHSAGDDFINRYARNATLVASGVAKNMKKMGNYVKESLDDILFPYKRRPK